MTVSKNSSEKNGANPRKRVSFALSGRSLGLDHRIHAYRDDVADIALAGKVLAHYYAVPVLRQCTETTAGVYEEPVEDATMVSQLLKGENFAVIDENGGWAWGYCEHDHYVGYVLADKLGEAKPSDISQPVDDPVSFAESFIDTPYLWGGRSASGIDCSGLVQIAYGRAGLNLPRDSDLQLEALDQDVPEDTKLQRGDLIFFPDHVGIMEDSEELIHATRHWGKVVREPLADVVARISEQHEEPVAGRKRITI